VTQRFVPSDDERALVGKLAGYGLPVEWIARLVRNGISPVTLRRVFAQELETGRAQAIAQVSETLFQKAIGGDLGACCFFLKCRAGWRESTNRLELSGPNGEPVPHGVMLVPAALDPTEWERVVSKQQAELMESGRPRRVQ
jgi:hypothetical protein